MTMSHPYAYFVTRPSQPGDGPPEWPQGATRRIVGIKCPMCGHSKSGPEYRNNASFGQTVTCTKCGWTGKVPL